MKRLVLVGGGHAHVHCLAALEKVARGKFDVTLISPYPRQVYSGMLPGWIAGHYALDDCVIPLLPLAARAGVRFLPSRVTAIDPAARSVRCADGTSLGYDVLSLDTGTVFDPAVLPGAAEHGLMVRPIEEFISGWQALAERLERADHARIVVVGGGAAGTELLLAMQHAHPRFAFTLISAADTLPGRVSPRLARQLRRRGVSRFDNVFAASISSDAVTLADGTCIAADATIVAIGSTAGFTIPAPGLTRDERGFVLVNTHLQSVSHPEIFAAGDCASMAQHPRPKSGVYAVRAGKPLATNLLAALHGTALTTHIPPRHTLYLISTGGRHAIGSWGPFAWEGDWTWRWKDKIDRAFLAKYQ